MSICYWMIEGIGIDANKVAPYIDKKKMAGLLSKELPDDEYVSDIISNEKYDELNVDDFLYGEPFENIADLFTFCDDTDVLTYGDDGDGGHYLYYPPSMPWHRVSNEPNSIEEVHQRIIAAVMALTTLSENEIESMIDDDLYVVGIG